MPRSLPTRAWLPLLLLSAFLMAGCDSAGPEVDGDVIAGVDLDALFAPATAAEVAAVESSWATRDVSAQGVSVVASGDISTGDVWVGGWSASVRVFAHRVGAVVHYGAVLVPAIEPDRERPVLLYLHGSDDGVSIEGEVLPVIASAELRDEFIVVVPSFRAEPIRFGGEVYLSDGPASPWDGSVDDALALLQVAIDETPSADAERIAAIGFSGGATVGLLAAIRDARIDGVVDFAGPTDFLGPFARDVFRAALLDEPPSLPGIDALDELLVQPLKDGERSIEAVRFELILRSPVYFADRLPMLQMHHGLLDDVVPPSESQALEAALDEVGNSTFELHLYETGAHHPLTMTGAIDRATAFLLQVANPVGT